MIADYERVLGHKAPDLSRSIAPRGLSPHRNSATKRLDISPPAHGGYSGTSDPSRMPYDECPWERTEENQILPLVWPK
jgi:hypothetical protein